MYDRLMALWLDGRLTETMVDNAVKKNWISAAQGETIKSTPRSETATASASAL